MATTLTILSAAPLLNGAGSAQRGYVGRLSGNWVMQYKFTTPSAGYVTGLTFRSDWYHTAGFNFSSYPVRAYVTTSATSHVNAGSTAAYHASMYAESTGGYNVAVAINDLQLSPSTTYYLYLFAGYTSSYRYSAHNYSAGQTNYLEATVAMESELSAGNGTLGTSQILKVTQKSASYTHTITYSCGTASGTICTKSKNTSVNWTPPLALASQNTTGTTVSVVLTITTYNGDSVIGSKSVTIICAIPASVKPQVADGWAKAAVYNVGTKAEGMPLFVQGYSKAQVTLDESLIDLSGAYGAEIASYKIVHNGTAVTASPFRTGTMKTAGEHTIACYVYDTRGRYASETLSVTVQPYANPTLSGVSVYRSNSLGDETDEGTYISVIAAPTISSLDGLNGYTLQVRYGANGSNYGAYEDLAPNTLMQIGDGVVLTTQSYMVEILLTDLLGNTAVYTHLVPTAEAFFHGRAGGGGAAFGKYSEEDDLLDVAWNQRIRKSLYLDGGLITSAPIAPRNLLDNSEFKIAQAGYGGKHGAVIYAADRWRQNDTTERTYSYTTYNGYGALKCTTETRIQQKVYLAGGVPYTAAVKINGVIRVVSFTADGVGGGSGQLWVNYQSDGTYMFVVTNIPANALVSEPVLYRGEYTAETLPPYAPKGTAHELLECQRYFYAVHGGLNGGIGLIRGNLQAQLQISIPVPMRTNPTVSYNYVSGSRYMILVGVDGLTNVTSLAFQAAQQNCIALTATVDTQLTSTRPCVVTSSGGPLLAFSADL